MGEFFLFHPVYEGMTYGPPPDLCTEQKKGGRVYTPSLCSKGKRRKIPPCTIGEEKKKFSLRKGFETLQCGKSSKIWLIYGDALTPAETPSYMTKFNSWSNIRVAVF